MEKPIEIAVVSAKGGAGKTLLAASFGKLTDGKVIADCDVDTPNMHLLLNPTDETEGVFLGGKKAVLDMRRCTQCGECFKACRFGAVRERGVPEGWLYSIDTLSCEGCGVCVGVCPEGALDMTITTAGAWYVSDSDLGPLVHASLAAGYGDSGDLVRIVRREARRVAVREDLAFVIIDGPAGVGPGVVAAIAGVAVVLVVAEPSVSGLRDTRRVVELGQKYGAAVACVINKHDVNPEVTLRIEEFLSGARIALLGRIPFSRAVSKAIADCGFVVDLADDPAAEEIRAIVGRLQAFAGTRRAADPGRP
jgi:MinD superfamily P-loop ATPase